MSETEGTGNFTGIHHVAYVVGDMDAAVAFFEQKLGLKLAVRKVLPEDLGFEMAVFWLGPTRLELMRPYREGTSQWSFLQKMGSGLHHVAFAVEGIERSVEALRREGLKVGNPGPVATGWTVAAVDPSTSLNTLTQLAEG